MKQDHRKLLHRLLLVVSVYLVAFAQIVAAHGLSNIEGLFEVAPAAAP